MTSGCGGRAPGTGDFRSPDVSYRPSSVNCSTLVALATITPTGDGYYLLTDRLSGLSLNVDSGSTADGTAVNQWTYTAIPSSSGRSSPPDSGSNRRAPGAHRRRMHVLLGRPL
ncbi:RICIN domain-containing protein [Streptomyces sp. NPDC001307]|uniref:RICIN domain-containing protein n=1 Tax=Streptomyces sp. NPDC001307 TaxID=3364560 RepID=UPI0036A3B5B3